MLSHLLAPLFAFIAVNVKLYPVAGLLAFCELTWRQRAGQLRKNTALVLVAVATVAGLALTLPWLFSNGGVAANPGDGGGLLKLPIQCIQDGTQALATAPECQPHGVVHCIHWAVDASTCLGNRFPLLQEGVPGGACRRSPFLRKQISDSIHIAYGDDPAWLLPTIDII